MYYIADWFSKRESAGYFYVRICQKNYVPGEGIIYYDIRFTAYIKETEIKILVNIEAQKSSDHSKLGYHLEELLSEKNTVEKKRILAKDYGMRMTAELEGRIQIMCNLSENIIERERMDAIKRMIKANATKEQIVSFGYTEDEYKNFAKTHILLELFLTSIFPIKCFGC